jgi:hypothetical protein
VISIQLAADAELSGRLDPLVKYLDARHIPSDLTQDIDAWSVVECRPFIRPYVGSGEVGGTDLDHEDAMFGGQAVRRLCFSGADSAAAVAASRQDTALSLFNKTMDLFCGNLGS